MIRKLDPEKLAKLPNTGTLLDRKYGVRGTATRTAFEEKAYAFYYSKILKDRRKELKMTQQQLAEIVGKERSYIAHIERGQTDMQLSSLINISNALGMRLSLNV
jgi:DNA-binding XRE family transcriptional regulator